MIVFVSTHYRTFPSIPLFTQRPLAGQTALIFGGSGGMGGAAAEHAADLGASVVPVGRDRDRLEAAAGSLDARLVVADAGVPDEAVRAFVEAATVHHVVVATSADVQASSVPDTPPAVARAAFGRLWVAFNVVHHASGRVEPGGSVVIVSGSSATTPAPGYGVWTALHGSIEPLARTAALELAPVRGNVVSPGGIGMPPDRQLTHHVGTAADVGAAVAALMANPAITNAVLGVDGGERLGTWSGA